ncbi:MAG: S1/P1 nuclease [Tepidisphaeraceae bacterium]|jgi:hypothetical protein
MRIVFWLLWLTVGILPTHDATAWSDSGHMVMACITYAELTPAVRQKVVALLHKHPRYEQDLLAGMPEGFPDPDLYAFMKAATWPDMVRSFQNPLHRTEHHANWHYIDYPLVSPADRQTLNPPSPAEGGGEVDNILKALAGIIAGLKDPHTPDDRKAVQICWLCHLVGDLHQPLHCVSLFSPQFPDGDKGGNLFLVSRAGGEVINLHAEWDGILGPAVTPHAVKLVAQNILANPNHQRAAIPELATHTSFKSWADEGVANAWEFVYLQGRLRSARSETTAQTRPSELVQPATRQAARERYGSAASVPALPVSYEDLARQLARLRIATGAYRLADQLNAMLQ